jgi:hypothetical protein
VVARSSSSKVGTTMTQTRGPGVRQDVGGIGAGISTTRTPTTPLTKQQRAQRDAVALAKLTAWGCHDIADILGLTPTPPPTPPARRPAVPRKCAVCDKQFTPRNAHNRCCSRICGAALGARTKAHERLTQIEEQPRGGG